MLTKRQNSNTHGLNDDLLDKKQIDDSPNTNYFNFQSSNFFNHHLSSKSSDANDQTKPSQNELVDFLSIKHKSRCSRRSNISRRKRKSFDFSYDQKELLEQNKLPISTNTCVNNDFYAKYHSNSAIVSVRNYSNYILKSDIKSSSLKTKRHNLNHRMTSNNDNLILKYYSANHTFFRTNSNVTNPNSNNGDKIMFGLGDIDSIANDESESSGECRNEVIESGSDSNEDDDGGFIMTQNSGEFNLNYIGNAIKGKFTKSNTMTEGTNNNRKGGYLQFGGGVFKEDENNGDADSGEFILSKKSKFGGGNKSSFTLNNIRSLKPTTGGSVGAGGGVSGGVSGGVNKLNNNNNNVNNVNNVVGTNNNNTNTNSNNPLMYHHPQPSSSSTSVVTNSEQGNSQTTTSVSGNNSNSNNNPFIFTKSHTSKSPNVNYSLFTNNNPPQTQPLNMVQQQFQQPQPQHQPQQPSSSITPQTQDLLSKAQTLIKDQPGCRFLQKKIDEDPRISDPLFSTLYYDLVNMCTDSFGNYLIQKMLDYLSNENIACFTELLSSKFTYVAMSSYGTRVIQKLLEIFSLNPKHAPTFHRLNELIINNLIQITKDSNSSHIIIKYVNVVKHPDNNALFESIAHNFMILSKDKHGCCVIQKTIEAANQQQKEQFFTLCNNNCNELINDQFGNYVIQYVVGLNTEIINKYIVELIMSNVLYLCKEKYASNVVERFLCNKNSYSKSLIEIIVNNDAFIHELLVDSYGNYIIQRILMIVVGEERLKIVKLVVEWFEEIKALSFGERLIAKLSERYQEFNVLVRQKYGIMPGSSGGMNNYNNTNTTNAMGGYMLMNGANPSLFFQQKQMMLQQQQQQRMKMMSGNTSHSTSHRNVNMNDNVNVNVRTTPTANNMQYMQGQPQEQMFNMGVNVNVNNQHQHQQLHNQQQFPFGFYQRNANHNMY